MLSRSFRAYHHALIVERKNSFIDVENWLADNVGSNYQFELLEVPHTAETYASVYIENQSDAFLFKLRWDVEE